MIQSQLDKLIEFITFCSLDAMDDRDYFTFIGGQVIFVALIIHNKNGPVIVFVLDDFITDAADDGACFLIGKGTVEIIILRIYYNEVFHDKLLLHEVTNNIGDDIVVVE